jgi:hypothetical protein
VLTGAGARPDHPISGNSTNYAPKLFASLKPAERDNLTKNDLRLAMESLFKDGTITNEAYGPPSNARTRIVRSAKPT